MSETVALIVAAGRGERAGTGIPKQYRKLAGKGTLRWALDTFASHPSVDRVRIVIGRDDGERYRAAVAGLDLADPVIGGATRQESVRNGLEALSASPPERVLIHDGARPLVSGALIARVVAGLTHADAVAPFLPVNDTLRRKQGRSYETVPREDLVRAQTPQGFSFAKILHAHRAFADIPATDDLQLAERAGLAIAAVAGEEMNLKLTSQEDFAFAERLAGSALADVRTGAGFDAHGFAAGDHVWLCGVKLPHDRGLEGHSDADAGLHALTDAILGAISAADIGAHFPPSDERWRGASSHVFLQHAAAMVRAGGGVISHVDVTLICERPKISAHRDSMRARIAEILDIGVTRVSVKATTTDGLGFTGRREGIAASAVATIRLPS
jgi:2-C-methyl-D-erythritol 4-phosphate cytidylyltransferase/2-C-methyl-D-erythritol 2,4-cyclodiphosphate synthase